ncbi:hypothetical protein Pmar_PMAR020273 [Perkinsus marinus ATCC 50983]|uniref:Uncharacterized protein n=1 Tax=Perkinsus marinus (strain ATCC 50983 / TXsc) TaxID=423536 RepID=C5LU17_PERM5|nr:hypothetical protein Pmar_PMAR020273 [Perkinsus marinus ATCC 50983]EEQ99815.1 hypothetical protein Pmar_PMAR020273 [Perkinsus marinus ATCC 50983]|eukprot:XP_002767098.1 hypothetical protein Pmar_PMAR020273 [Perkinsus marinus ATCC 50983]
MMQKSAGGSSSLPEMISEFALYIGKRELSLDCPREQVLVSPSPSYIFVMGDSLCGVYPGPTGVHIREPLNRGEEVMVLYPGFEASTRAVYYHHGSQLFVLCEDNRKLIRYDLRSTPGPSSTSVKLLGLPESRLINSNDKGAEMVCTDDFVFFLFGSKYLFCIDRQNVSDGAQAKLIWTARAGEARKCHMLVDPEQPLRVRLVIPVFRSLPSNLVTLELQNRREPLFFKKVMEKHLSIQTASASAVGVYDVLPVGCYNLAVSKTPSNGYHRVVTLCDRSFRALGPDATLFRYDTSYEPRRQQLVCGERDVIYSMEEGGQFRCSYDHCECAGDLSDDDDDDVELVRKKKRCKRETGTPCLISAYYISKK